MPPELVTKDQAALRNEVAGRSGFCSFDADTQVVLADGTLRIISRIQPGDRVFSTDP